MKDSQTVTLIVSFDTEGTQLELMKKYASKCTKIAGAQDNYISLRLIFPDINALYEYWNNSFNQLINGIEVRDVAIILATDVLPKLPAFLKKHYPMDNHKTILERKQSIYWKKPEKTLITVAAHRYEEANGVPAFYEFINQIKLF